MLLFSTNFFKKFFWRKSVLFCRDTDTSGDICPGFQSKGGFPHLCTLSPACNGFFRFTSCAAPADLLVASTVTKPFRSMYLHTSIGGAGVQDCA